MLCNSKCAQSFTGTQPLMGMGGRTEQPTEGKKNQTNSQ